MSPSTSNTICLEFPFSIWDRIWAAFVLIPQRRLNIIIHSVIPLIGLSVLGLLLSRGHPIELDAWLVIGTCFFFTPAVTVFAVFINYITNKSVREPFSYTFDANGIHVLAATYAYTNPWTAINKVKCSGGFLMFFISPGYAHCIPLKAIRRSNQYEPLLSLARINGVPIM